MVIPINAPPKPKLMPTSLFPQITKFLQFVKQIYADLPNTMVSLFEPGGPGNTGEDAGAKGSAVSTVHLLGSWEVWGTKKALRDTVDFT